MANIPPVTMSHLPIEKTLPELLAIMQLSTKTVLSAPPGAGKTTRVPLELLKLIPPGSGKIIMLEPRRIAAVSAARYMAQLLGEPVGQTVGYAIRFEAKASANTRIEVVTEGILTRRIQRDPELTGVACVVFDEFHERTIHADLGLALCLETQMAFRPDLKILVMSATLDCISISRLLGDAPVVSSAGHAFPVDIRYQKSGGSNRFTNQMAAVIKTVLSEEKGDLLAFLPGSSEIRSVQRELGQITGVAVCPLYGDLPFEQQQQAILPGPCRRVVLATNIAETSLTIEGVRIVIDSGLTRRLQLDPSTGLESLVTVRSSQASARQRAGRAGRITEGVCYRLYSEQTFNSMTPFTPPEIKTSDLSPLLLELAAWGTGFDSLAWLDLPPVPHIVSGHELLQMLGAIDAAGAITQLGRRMVNLPLHPRLSRLLIAAEEQNILPLACRFAASFSSRTSASAVIDRIEKQLLQMMKATDKSDVYSTDESQMALLCILSWPDRIGRRRTAGESRYLLSSGRGAVSRNNGSEFLVALQVDGGEGPDGIIHQSMEVTADQIRRIVPHLILKERQIAWDDEAGRISVTEQELIGAVLLSSRQLAATDEESCPLLLEQVRRIGIASLGWNKDSRQLQSRVGLASTLLPEDGWPDLSDLWLEKNLSFWLEPRLSGIRSWREIERIDMSDLLKELIGWKLIQALDSVAPATVNLPSGRRIDLDYTIDEGPVLSVKLQELFGMVISPTVCRGRRGVLVQMLSPAGRPVAVTRDLAGFWERGYQDVRKELRGRYPKHPWPDDPWSAVPTHKTKKALENRGNNKPG